jgi:DNA-binding PadR family transcriptional regulator
MLRENPRNGAEIMDSMEQMSQGWWRPSPGSVYPLLEELEKEGVIQKQPDGRYALSARAREEMGFPLMGGVPRDLNGTMDELTGLVSYLEDLRATRGDELRALAGRLQALGARLTHLTDPPRNSAPSSAAGR